MNLMIVERDEVGSSGQVMLTGARAVHLLNVLKVVRGDHVRVGLLDGPRGVGAVQAVSDGTIELQCEFESLVPARPRIDLLLALPRPKVMRRLWAQLAALGVGRIMLTNAERVERNYFDTHVLSAECFRPLLIEGLQQAQDTRLPEVSVHRRFKVLVEDELDAMFGRGVRIVAEPAAATPPAEIARRHPDQRILLAVGPEGGWSAFELALLQRHGFQPAGMGRRTLRTDTACIALMAVVNAMERDGSQ
jgi:RsmE family RNA methyltransferase